MGDLTSNCATSSGTSQRTHSRWTGRTCAPSRARSAARWPNTSPSSSRKSPTSNVPIWTPVPLCSASYCSHSCTQQHTERYIELLADASSIGLRWNKQNVFWGWENCFHEAQSRSLTRQMQRPKQRQRARGARDGATGRRSQQRQ